MLASWKQPSKPKNSPLDQRLEIPAYRWATGEVGIKRGIGAHVVVNREEPAERLPTNNTVGDGALIVVDEGQEFFSEELEKAVGPADRRPKCRFFTVVGFRSQVSAANRIGHTDHDQWRDLVCARKKFDDANGVKKLRVAIEEVEHRILAARGLVVLRQIYQQ